MTTSVNDPFTALDRLIKNKPIIAQQLRQAGQPDLADQVTTDINLLLSFNKNMRGEVLEALQATHQYLTDLLSQPLFDDNNLAEAGQLLLKRIEVVITQLTEPIPAGRSELTVQDVFGEGWQQLKLADLEKYFDKNQNGSRWGYHRRAIFSLGRYRKSVITLGEVASLVKEEAAGQIKLPQYGPVARNLMLHFFCKSEQA